MGLKVPFPWLLLTNMAPIGDFVHRVTDPAKLDVIAATQASDNEQHRSVVSRSFVCKCVCFCSNYSRLIFRGE